MRKFVPMWAMKYIPFALVFFVFILGFGYQHFRIVRTERSLLALESSQSFFSQNFTEDLFKDNLKMMQAIVAESSITALQKELDDLRAANPEDVQIDEVYESLSDLEQKIQRNKSAGLNQPDLTDLRIKWGEDVLDKDFSPIISSIAQQTKLLDDEHAAYLKKLEQTVVAATGYSFQTVQTERGTFTAYVIKVPLSSVRVKTLSASSGTCKDNCQTKSLADYVRENGGFAGMNGSYFCPPDYSSCGGKINSSDFALYDSNEGRWEHKDALGWSETGLLTFNGSDPSFYKKSTEYGGGGVSAGISNYPSLVKDGNIVVEDDDMTTYQKDVKGPRGVIGVGGENLYLAIINSATVKDAAYVIRALGAKHALNLDGGGSSAMFVNGGYVVGPGRSLPNAIVLIK
ncbi:MAG: phosphodiester glycosidase family protein [Patescibacteria group bacterium]|jgi:exopolysaccharide biosynthesis protein